MNIDCTLETARGLKLAKRREAVGAILVTFYEPYPMAFGVTF